MTQPKIDTFRFGRVVIDGNAYSKDVMILPEGVKANWRRKEGHNLQAEDLDWVMAAQPEILLVGKGTVNRMQVSEEAIKICEGAGIEMIALSSSEACDRYNEIRMDRKTALALHLTC